MKGHRLALTAAVAISGAASLILEVVWFRRLGLSSGVVAGAAGVVTAAYMGGLALGNYLGSRISDRSRYRLWIYAGAEALVAFSALVAPRVLAPLASDASPLAWTAVGAVLLIPTTAMGLGLPLLACSFGRDTSHGGRIAAFLYGVNTTGAGLGVAWVGFFGLSRLGPEAVTTIAIALQSVVVLIVASVAVRVGPESEYHSQTREAGAPHWGALCGAGLASAAAMWVQVTWTERAATWVTAPGQGFSMTVLAYLVGLALGGFFAMTLIERFRSLHRTVTVMLAITATALACAALFAGHWQPTPGAATLAVVLPLVPMTASGGTLFPLFIACSLRSGATIGVAVGTTGAASTLGAIVGSLVGAVLVPLFEVGPALAAGVIAYGGLGGVFWLATAGDTDRP
ncbi:MAG: hypothetical protein AAFQ65_11165 [Myxococcota bacterium]